MQKWKWIKSEPGILIFLMRILSFCPNTPVPSVLGFYTVLWSVGVHYYGSQ